jgi:hypothetical protein
MLVERAEFVFALALCLTECLRAAFAAGDFESDSIVCLESGAAAASALAVRPPLAAISGREA